MNSNDTNDAPLIDELTPLPEGALSLAQAPQALRGAILQQTLPVVRRRRWLRRVRWAGGLAAAYAAGLTTMVTVSHLNSPEPRQIIEVRAVPAAAVPPQEAPVLPASAPVPPPVSKPEEKVVTASAMVPQPSDPLAIRRAAAYAPFEERAELLRRAGDLYLEEQADVERALECYSEYLNELDPAKLRETAQHDNWLLLSLKQARMKEAS